MISSCTSFFLPSCRFLYCYTSIHLYPFRYPTRYGVWTSSFPLPITRTLAMGGTALSVSSVRFYIDSSPFLSLLSLFPIDFFYLLSLSPCQFILPAIRYLRLVACLYTFLLL